MLTVGDVCRVIGLGERHVAKLFDDGMLSGYRTEKGHRRIHRRSVVAYLRDRGLSDEMIPRDLVCDVLLLGDAAGFASELGQHLKRDDFRIHTTAGDAAVVVVVDEANAARQGRRRGAIVVGLLPEDDSPALRELADRVLQQPVTSRALADAIRELQVLL